MTLGIIADSHGNSDAVIKALSIFKEKQISIILHAGDFGPASTYNLFRDFVLHMVKGNNDNLDELEFYAEKYGQPAPREFKLLNFNQKNIFLYHGDKNILYNGALKENYSYIVRGHSHYPEDFTVNKTRVINPGALYRSSDYTIGILDPKDDTWNVLNLKGEKINEKNT